MTHFNHDWDTAKTPAIPVSVGDRYYAQDLNDDFNYLKHLPYEVFLQGKSRGVMISPNDTWDDENNILTLSGGFGVILQDCIELDPNEDFIIPPKTHSSPRYERTPFTDTILILPNDSAVHYIVATPTKRSFLQRTKALFTEQYASRIRYDGIITIQDTAPTAGQILVGLCHNKEYCLLTDINPNQCKDNIILKKWFGQNKITQDLVPILQSYYDTTVNSVESKISIGTIDGGVDGINNGTFNNCTISIDTVKNGNGINNGTFNNCTISIDRVSGIRGISNGTFNNCTISIGTISSGSGVYDGTFNNCTISIDAVNSGKGIYNGTFNNCIIPINTVGAGNGIEGDRNTFNNCIISIGTVNSGSGVYDGTFNNCTISIGTVGVGEGVINNSGVVLYLTRIICTATTNLSYTGGKLNILNSTILHAS